MKRRFHSARRAALLLSVLALSGCAGTGILNDTLDGLGGSRVSGEVRSVDARRREIHLRTNRGRSETVVFDRNTRVVQRQRSFSVGDLERGDEVSMQVQRDRRGGLYTDLIRVDRSVRDRRGARDRDRDERRERVDTRTQAFEGRVVRIDHGQGWFELREDRRGSYRVTLPYRASSSITDRFRRLRRGDHVRLSGQLLNRERIELQRFR